FHRVGTAPRRGLPLPGRAGPASTSVLGFSAATFARRLRAVANPNFGTLPRPGRVLRLDQRAAAPVAVSDGPGRKRVAVLRLSQGVRSRPSTLLADSHPAVAAPGYASRRGVSFHGG